MVSIFTVYDHTENASRYVIANEEGFNWQTADTVSNSDFTLDNDELIKKVVLGSWTWDALTSEPCWDQHQFEDDEFELFKYCEFEFYKKDCKYFGTKVRLSIDKLPNELYSKLSEDYIRWSHEEGVGCLTDGYEVFMDAGYEPPTNKDDDIGPYDNLAIQLQEIKNFRKWFNDLIGPNATEEKLQELYESFITISVAGNSVKLPFDAENFNNIDTVLERCIEEW